MEKKQAELQALEVPKTLSKKEKKALEKKKKKEENNIKKVEKKAGPETTVGDKNPHEKLQGTASDGNSEALQTNSITHNVSDDSDDLKEADKNEHGDRKWVKMSEAAAAQPEREAVAAGAMTDSRKHDISPQAIIFNQNHVAEEIKWDGVEEKAPSPVIPVLSNYELMQQMTIGAKGLRKVNKPKTLRNLLFSKQQNSKDIPADDDSVVHNVPHTFKGFALHLHDSSLGKGGSILESAKVKITPQEKFAKIWGAGLSYEHTSPVVASPGQKAAAVEKGDTFSSLKMTRNPSPSLSLSPARVSVAATAANSTAKPTVPMIMTKAESPTNLAPKLVSLPAVSSDLKTLNVKKYKKAFIQNYWKKST